MYTHPSNANDTRDNSGNIESQQQQHMAGLVPLDGNFSLSRDHLILLQLQQQQQQRRGQPSNLHLDFSSAGDTMEVVPSFTWAPIGFPDPAVRFGRAINHSQHPSNIPSIAVNDRNFRPFWDLQELAMLLELERQRTERAVLHGALAQLHKDASVGQSFAHLQQSGLHNTISAEQSSGSLRAMLPSSTLHHSAPCSQSEVLCAGSDSVVPPHPQSPSDLVVASQLNGGDASEAPLVATSFAAGAVAYSISKENDEHTGPSKPSKEARCKKWNAAKEDHFGSKRLQNDQINHKRRHYNAESFVQKLFRLITDQERAGNTHIVEFVDSGGGFWLREPDAISKLMPKYSFRGNKFCGFRRQLYSYGFRVEKEGKNKGAYGHPLFSRGNAELCKQIKRDNRYDFGPYDLDSSDESDKSDGYHSGEG